MKLGGIFAYKLTSYLPINCIWAVILVIICPNTSRLPQYQNIILRNMGHNELIVLEFTIFNNMVKKTDV